jgi:nuclear pore complex protein Nup54
MSFSFGNLGSNLNTTERKTGTLFGSTTAPAGGLFAQPQQQQQQQPANTAQPSLFGSTQQQNTTPSLFGQSQQQNTAPSLFGQPQQQNSGPSLFSQPQQQNAGSSLFGQTQQPQQQQQGQQQQPSFNNSLFGASLQPAPALNQSQTQVIQQQREGLPQLRQSSAQPYASSISGQSRLPYCGICSTLTFCRREVGRGTDKNSQQ